jgi:dihydrofolate reductase
LTGFSKNTGKWSGPFFNDEAGQFKWGELRASDALLLGRKTYESFAAAWPSMTDDAGFADRMNSMPKDVASSTLDCCDWSGSQPLTGDVAEKVRTLKKEPGRDLLLRKRPTC